VPAVQLDQVLVAVLLGIVDDPDWPWSQLSSISSYVTVPFIGFRVLDG